MLESNNGELERPTPVEPADIKALERRHVADAALIDELQAELKVGVDKIANLEIALASARRIGSAVGILMERNKITEVQAFEHLRIASQHTGRKLRDIAQDLIDTGALPS